MIQGLPEWLRDQVIAMLGYQFCYQYFPRGRRSLSAGEDIVSPGASDDEDRVPGSQVQDSLQDANHTGLIVLVSVAATIGVCSVVYFAQRFYRTVENSDKSADLTPSHDITLNDDDILDRSV